MKRLRVLLLEDDPPSAEFVRIELRRLEKQPDLGFDVDWVETLAAAREHMRRETYDVAVVDLNVPDSRGAATVAAVKRARRVPTVVLTGLADRQVAVHAVLEGAEEYLVKDEVSGPALARSILLALTRCGIDVGPATRTLLGRAARLV